MKDLSLSFNISNEVIDTKFKSNFRKIKKIWSVWGKVSLKEEN